MNTRHETRGLSYLRPIDDRDPREEQGGDLTVLATRRSLPVVTQRKAGSDGLTLLLGAGLVLGLGGVTLWSLDRGRQPKPVAVQTQPTPVQPTPSMIIPPPVPTQAITPLPTVPPPAPMIAPAAPPPGTLPGGNPLANPTVVYDASALPPPAAVPTTPPAAPAANGAGNDDFAAKVGGVGGGAAVATVSIDPKTTVAQGTLIPAVLETAIDTDVPGYVRAVVSSDIRSFDGTRVLVPRSSRLIGQYKSGLTAGQKRAYVIWTRLIRPDGVSVNIASPAVGFGGETGLPGKVNSHFFERFGSAMLLSVIGGVSALASSGSSVIISSQGQSAAAAAIGQTGQIAPTVRVRQGEPIRVFTARDLDFSKVSAE